MSDQKSFFKSLRTRRSRFMQTHYKADGIGIRGKNMGFLDESRFAEAWEAMVEGEHGAFRHRKWMNGRVPDIRWRTHLNCWAAETALALEGDFVELGTATGVQAATVCGYLDFARLDKTFFLFDTFAGIPIVEGMTDQEQSYARDRNEGVYFDCLSAATTNFSAWPNVRLVAGILPQSIDGVRLDKVAYLHIDLNNAVSELETMAVLWDRITPGAPIVLDDYAARGHEAQYEGWNAFAADKGYAILTLPTGQGLMLKR